jgi:hypothetical protein
MVKLEKQSITMLITNLNRKQSIIHPYFLKGIQKVNISAADLNMFTVFFFYIESPKGIKDAAKIIPKVLHPCVFLVKMRQ